MSELTSDLEKDLLGTKYQDLQKRFTELGIKDVFQPGKKKIEMIAEALELLEAQKPAPDLSGGGEEGNDPAPKKKKSEEVVAPKEDKGGDDKKKGLKDVEEMTPEEIAIREKSILNIRLNLLSAQGDMKAELLKRLADLTGE